MLFRSSDAQASERQYQNESPVQRRALLHRFDPLRGRERVSSVEGLAPQWLAPRFLGHWGGDAASATRERMNRRTGGTEQCASQKPWLVSPWERMKLSQQVISVCSDQLNDGHLGVVTSASDCANDACVAATAFSVPVLCLVEQSVNKLLVVDVTNGATSRGEEIGRAHV